METMHNKDNWFDYQTFKWYRYFVSYADILKSKVSKYHGGPYRSKSWITKVMDSVFYADKQEIDKLPSEVKIKLTNYIADKLLRYPKYKKYLANWK